MHVQMRSACETGRQQCVRSSKVRGSRHIDTTTGFPSLCEEKIQDLGLLVRYFVFDILAVVIPLRIFSQSDIPASQGIKCPHFTPWHRMHQYSHYFWVRHLCRKNLRLLLQIRLHLWELPWVGIATTRATSCGVSRVLVDFTEVDEHLVQTEIGATLLGF